MTTTAATTRKKLVIVQDYLRNGGTERQSLHLARTLAEIGYDVTLLTFRPGGTLYPKTQPTNSAPCRIIALQPVDLHLDFFAPNLLRTLRHLAPDIVLCMGRMANCKGARIARALPAAAVISTMRTGKTLPAAYARSLHATRHTICNSHEAARILRETYNVPAEKLTVIHNAIVFPPDTGRARSPGAPQNIRLLCSAMFRPEKNQRELLEIFSQIKSPGPLVYESASGLTLHFLGDGPELPSCRALAQRLNIADRVHFHGFVSNPATIYQQTAPENTIAVLTSQSESLPNFLVETHAHGIPSVAYSVGGVAECGGIAIPSGNQPAFLDALTRLIIDTDFRASESARVAAHARKHFSPQTQLDRYITLFDKLIT